MRLPKNNSSCESGCFQNVIRRFYVTRLLRWQSDFPLGKFREREIISGSFPAAGDLLFGNFYDAE